MSSVLNFNGLRLRAQAIAESFDSVQKWCILSVGECITSTGSKVEAYSEVFTHNTILRIVKDGKEWLFTVTRSDMKAAGIPLNTDSTGFYNEIVIKDGSPCFKSFFQMVSR